MKTLHLYITRQILGTLFMAALVLTFVFVLGSVVKEIMALLVSQHVSFWLIMKAVGLLVPFVLAFVFPMALLTSTLLVFGRFSADMELTAVRASGVSLLALSSPVLLLSVGFSVFCGWVNLDLAPRSRVAYRQLLYQIGLQRPAGTLQENQYQEIAPNQILYAARIRGLDLEQVEVYILDEHGKSMHWLRAPTGSIEVKGNDRTLILTNSYGGTREGDQVRSDGTQSTLRLGPFEFKPPSETAPAVDLSDMTFRQLMSKRRELERMGIQDLTPVLVQMHRQVSFSFACIGFTLIGIPLGIQAHRRETTAGAAIALVLVMIYYSFIILSQSLITRPEYGPQFIVWLPNFIFQVTGGYLLWKANRGV